MNIDLSEAILHGYRFIRFNISITFDFCFVCHPKICCGPHWPPLKLGGATLLWAAH